MSQNNVLFTNLSDLNVAQYASLLPQPQHAPFLFLAPETSTHNVRSDFTLTFIVQLSFVNPDEEGWVTPRSLS
jgi:hypothetical protein